MNCGLAIADCGLGVERPRTAHPIRNPQSEIRNYFHPRLLASATTTAAAPSSPSRSLFTTTS